MRDKTFYRVLIGVTIIGSLSVVALVAYTFMLHSSCSIISYIGNRG